jgi:hypothetical protein
MRWLTPLVLLFLATPANALHWEHPLTREQVVNRVIKESRLAYYQQYGGLCACPNDTASDGTKCGSRSARSRIGGAEPKCSPIDVTDADIHQWLERHDFLKKPWWIED